MDWRELPIHIIDFEGSRRSGIVEYGVVTLKGGAIAATHTRFCRPMGVIVSEETRLHGIRDTDTCAAAPFSEEWSFFCELRRTGPLGAHYASMEHGLLKAVWPYPMQCPDFLHPPRHVAQWGPWIDTCRLFEEVFPGLPAYKLHFLIDHFSLRHSLNRLAERHCPVQRRRVHAALYDALAAALLLKHLGRQERFQSMALDWLLTRSEPCAVRRQSLRQEDWFSLWSDL